MGKRQNRKSSAAGAGGSSPTTGGVIVADWPQTSSVSMSHGGMRRAPAMSWPPGAYGIIGIIGMPVPVPLAAAAPPDEYRF